MQTDANLRHSSLLSQTRARHSVENRNLIEINHPPFSPNLFLLPAAVWKRSGARTLPPQFLQRVLRPHLLRQHVDDLVARVDDDPLSAAIAHDRTRCAARAEADGYFVCDRARVAGG